MHKSIDLLAKAYAQGEQKEFDKYRTHLRETGKTNNIKSPIEDDPTIPWRFVVSYVYSLKNTRPELAKTILGEDVYKAYDRLLKDKTPGITEELLPYVSRIKMYDGVNKKNKRFKHWEPEKQARYLRGRTGGKPLTTHNRDKLVAAAIVDMFFKERIDKIKLS